MNTPSKEWMDQFNVGGGGPAISCCCGRTHVAIESIELPELEREKYQTSAEANPHGLILHYGVDSVSEHTFNGLTIVDGCACETMAKFESFVVRERDFILGYYRALAAKASAQAAALNAGLAKVAIAGEEKAART